MTLHFAYGSNMNRALMRCHAPDAVPLGMARLTNYRFVMMRCGYASVVPDAGQSVPGVLWRLTARDVAVLNAYESVSSGLYRAVRRSVMFRDGRRLVLVYIGRDKPGGRPKPGYMEAVLDAAEKSDLPPGYIASLRRLRPGRGGYARAKDAGEKNLSKDWREIEWP